MADVLYLCSKHLPSYNADRGGPVYYKQNIDALIKLGYSVHVRVLSDIVTKGPLIIEDAASMQIINPSQFLPKWFLSVASRTGSIFQEEKLVRGYTAYRNAIKKEIKDIKPDLIVADWIGSLVALPNVKGVPVVYIMHDFAHKIENLKRLIGKKSRSARGAADIGLLRDIEFLLIKNADVTLCASFTEARELGSEIGVQTGYIPIFGDGQAPDLTEFTQKPKVFLFGFTNTAMKSSLQTLEKVLREHPVANDRIELHHIGRVPCDKPPEWTRLEKLIKVKYHGYVKNLDEVFSFGDILLTPFTGGTGFRTKIVTAAAHGVLNIGMNGAFDCASEFITDENCITAESEEDLMSEVQTILCDSHTRRRLSLASRTVFEGKFNMDSRIDDYRAALKSLIKNFEHAANSTAAMDVDSEKVVSNGTVAKAS